MRRALLIPVLFAAGCGTAHHTATTAPPPQVAAPAAVVVNNVGSTAHDGALAVTVTSVRTEREADYPGGLPDPDKPQNGWFVVANVSEQNGGSTPATPAGFYVQTDDGARYPSVVEPAHDPEIVETAQQQLAPADQQRGNVVFDVPVTHGQIVYGDTAPVARWRF